MLACWGEESRGYWLIYRGHGFLAVFDSAPRPPSFRQHVVSLSQSSCVPPGWAYWRGGGGQARSQNMWLRESLALYKSFNTLCARIRSEIKRYSVNSMTEDCFYKDRPTPNPPAYVAWRAGTATPIHTRFLAPLDCSKIPAQNLHFSPMLSNPHSRG